MRRILPIALACTLASACISSQDRSVNTVDVANTDFGKLADLKRGEACESNVAFLIRWGDSNLATAAFNGNMRKVRSVAHRHETYILFNRYCTIAHGE